jgi:PAS domain S-box-containing protein
MLSLSNPGFLAAAFLNCSAALVLLILYVLLAAGYPARFFRWWLCGWMFYILAAALQFSRFWNRALGVGALGAAASVLAAAFFFATVLEGRGEGNRLRYLWPLAVLAPLVFAIVARRSLIAALWCESLTESSLLVVAGVLLWRWQTTQRRGVGWKLLSGSLLVCGLHGADQPAWSLQSIALFRFSMHTIFGITLGVAMAVVVLEAARARTEDLNEKLKGLALITAEATQSLRVSETLEAVLRHVTKSLGASHGAVFLWNAESGSDSLILKASSGFSTSFRSVNSRVLSSEPWVQQALEKSPRVISRRVFGAAKVPAWLYDENLAAVVVVSIAMKDKPFGLLCIGSARANAFEGDEVEFLANVADLLGLAVWNASLIEEAGVSRHQWLDTFNSIEDLIFVHAGDGRIVRANRALAWHFGLDADLIEGQSLRELLKAGDARWTVCPYCEGAAGKPEQVDPSFGGHFLVTTSGFFDSEGNVRGTIHVLKDFTERRQAENKYRTLFEKVHEGVFIATPAGRFLDFNDTFLRMLKYESRDELLRVDIPAELYIDPGDRQKLQRLLNEYGEVTDFEFQFRCRDGEIRVARESSFVTRDDSGVIVAYQGFILDVTEQKLAETEIRRRNRELLALNAIADVLAEADKLHDALTRAVAKVAELFSAHVAGVYFLDENAGTLESAANFGCVTEYARNMGAAQIPPLLLQQLRQTHATLLSGTALARVEQFRELYKQEGFLVSQVAVLWSKDRMIGALLIGSRDAVREFSTAELNLLAAVGNQIAITIDKSRLLEETREAYDTLRQMQEQLLQSEKMAAVGQLVSGVAHELNNPLTAILGYSELLKSEDQVSGRGAEYLEKLYKQAQRTHHIVQNLLSFARQRKPERGPAQLNRVIEDTLALREYDLKVHRIEVHRQLDPKLPEINADFHQLQQVCLNILNNAVDAISESNRPGQIWVRTFAEGENVRLEFTDNGPGVKNPHRVFDPFYTTKPVGKGTGLGLSICYGIVKEHGGDIEVRNEDTGGATFSLSLPLNGFGNNPQDPSLATAVTPDKAAIRKKILR